jgi:hypothetical protein
MKLVLSEPLQQFYQCLTFFWRCYAFLQHVSSLNLLLKPFFYFFKIDCVLGRLKLLISQAYSLLSLIRTNIMCAFSIKSCATSMVTGIFACNSASGQNLQHHLSNFCRNCCFSCGYFFLVLIAWFKALSKASWISTDKSIWIGKIFVSST